MELYVVMTKWDAKDGVLYQDQTNVEIVEVDVEKETEKNYVLYRREPAYGFLKVISKKSDRVHLTPKDALESFKRNIHKKITISEKNLDLFYKQLDSAEKLLVLQDGQ
jgi:cobalamin biosynthesis Co2+ chelatase CbiK